MLVAERVTAPHKQLPLATLSSDIFFSPLGLSVLFVLLESLYRALSQITDDSQRLFKTSKVTLHFTAYNGI